MTHHKAALAAAWRNPLSVLSDRSPGKRRPGALYNTKAERVLADDRADKVLGGFPKERVLAASRMRNPALGDLLPDMMPMDPSWDGAPGVDGSPPLNLGLPSVGLTGPIRSGSLGGPGPIGRAAPASVTDPEGGTDPIPGLTPDPPTEGDPPPGLVPDPPTTGNPPPEQPSSPVPEPATWVMQIAGMFLIGRFMRARNRKSRAASSTAALSHQG